MSGQDPAAGQQPQQPENLDEILVVQAATLLALEAGSAHAATAWLRRALADLRRAAVRRWLLAGGNPTGGEQLDSLRRDHIAQELVLHVRQIAAAVERDLPPVLRREALAALELGARHAGEQAGITVAADRLVLDETAQRIIDSTPVSAVSRLIRAADQISAVQTGQDLQAALHEADRTLGIVNTGSTYLTNYVANDAAMQVAGPIGAKLLWVAERNACVVCLALAGHIADPGQGLGFDEFATYGPYPAPTVWPPGMPLMRPPRHPHCRCQVCVWLGALNPGFGSLPESLRREAARSILKGWSLPSESNRVRLEAARQLLAAGGRGLPKTVQERSAADVARGRFESRTVPHHRPKEKTHV